MPASSGRSESSRASPRSSGAGTRPSASSACSTRTATSSRSSARSRTRRSGFPRDASATSSRFGRTPTREASPEGGIASLTSRVAARVARSTSTLKFRVSIRARTPTRGCLSVRIPSPSRLIRTVSEPVLGRAAPRQVEAARAAVLDVERVHECMRLEPVVERVGPAAVPAPRARHRDAVHPLVRLGLVDDRAAIELPRREIERPDDVPDRAGDAVRELRHVQASPARRQRVEGERAVELRRPQRLERPRVERHERRRGPVVVDRATSGRAAGPAPTCPPRGRRT